METIAHTGTSVVARRLKGDCREVLAALAERFDLAVLDPPANVGHVYGPHYDDNAPAERFQEMAASWWKAIRPCADRIVLLPTSVNASLWSKIAPPERESRFGLWQGSRLLGYQPVYFYGFRPRNMDLSAHLPEVREHEWEGPVDWYRKLFRIAKPSSVLDPFCGGGASLRAAEMMSIPATGIDLEEWTS